MSHVHGKFVWFEHMSSDTGKARKFYDSLLGWHTELTPMGGPEPYPLIMNGSEGIGGFRTAPPGAPAMWMSYLSVADVDAAHKAALAAGAKSLMAPVDFPGVGRGATLADPTGAAFSIFHNAHGDRADNAQDACRRLALERADVARRVEGAGLLREGLRLHARPNGHGRDGPVLHPEEGRRDARRADARADGRHAADLGALCGRGRLRRHGGQGEKPGRAGHRRADRTFPTSAASPPSSTRRARYWR